MSQDASDDSVAEFRSRVGTVRLALGTLLLLGLVAAAVAVGVVGLVFGAWACGQLFARWLPFSAFEATLISLLALVAVISFATRVLYHLLASPPRAPPERPLRNLRVRVR